MNPQSLQLDSSLLSARMRDFSRRPVESPTTRKIVQPQVRAPLSDVSQIAIQPVAAKTQNVIDSSFVQTKPGITFANEPATTSESIHDAASILKPEPINYIQRSIEWNQEHQKEKKPLTGKGKAINALLISMAAVVFIVGTLASINSFRVDRQVNAAKATTNAVSSTDPTEAKPSSDDLEAYSVAPDMPRFISIPKLNVKARILQVGLDKTDTLRAPSNVHDAGWFTGSAKPGSTSGAAVIDGHISGPTQHGIFYDAKKLAKGDTIEVEKGDGTKITYQVVSAETKNTTDIDMAQATESVESGKHGLNIISCAGKYNKTTKQYEQRIVVYAVKD